MDLDTLKARISASINKGTSYDSEIPYYVQMSLREIEANRTFKYMEYKLTETLGAGLSALPLTYDIKQLKRIRWIRYIDSQSGDYVYPKQVDGEQFLFITSSSRVNTPLPSGWYLTGDAVMQFDAQVDENLSMDFLYEVFSEISVTAGEFDDGFDEPWIAVNAPALLIADTIIKMSTLCREPEWQVEFKEMRDRGERTAFLVDEELRQSARSEEMLYAGSFR